MHRIVAILAACSLLIGGCSQSPFASSTTPATREAVRSRLKDYRVLYSFNGNRFDGSHPQGVLTVRRGLMYGTASSGGEFGFGTIFRVQPDGKNTYAYHSFDGGKDGCTPVSGVIFNDTRYYGTAASCGNSSKSGTVFSGEASNRAFDVVHTFDPTTDGADPEGGLYALGATLYGTTRDGGAHGKGTLYSIDVDTQAFKVVYNFGEKDEAANPMSSLISVDGKLVGTSYGGGQNAAGTVYEFDPKIGKERVVHSFDTADGSRPTAQLLSWAGTLYGVTTKGGTASAGVLFKMNPANGDETVLYQFGSGDALMPDGALVIVKDVLYGTTARGGATGKDDGTIFRYTLASKSFEEIYTFDGKPDGAHPRGGLAFQVADRQAQLFGTTFDGGTNDLGTAYGFAL